MSRIILVTGASGGIGAEVVRRLRLLGDTVIATDRTGADRDLDVSCYENWQSIIGELLDEHGRIDVLMNVAGVATAAPFWELPVDDMTRHLDVNIKGVALGCHTVIPHMLAQDSGHIVNIASLAGLAPVPGLAIYSASKFALRSLSLSLAIELADTGVDVSVVHPDVVDTPMIADHKTQSDAAMSFSGSRTLTAAEVANILTDTVLRTRPTEISIPRGRGALCKIASAFPDLAKMVAPAMRKRGIARQRAESSKAD